MSKYPAQIDTAQTLPIVVDGSTPVQGSIFNKLRSAVIAIESELGVKPSSIYTTVKARTDVLESTVGNLQVISLDEDLGGTLDKPNVIGIQGRPVSSADPSVGDVLVWNGIAWSPTTQDSSIIIFDGGSPSENIRSNRAFVQAQIDNSKQGIVNFSSNTGATTLNTIIPGVFGNFASILSGDMNQVNSDYSIIVGGLGNRILANKNYGIIIGGKDNSLDEPDRDTDLYCTIIGGENNNITGGISYAFIGGGYNNSITGESAVILSGNDNIADGGNSIIIGGFNNEANGTTSVIVGGDHCSTSGAGSVTIGGQYNSASGNYSMVSGIKGTATRYAQYTHSIGYKNDTLGNAQFSRVLAGETAYDGTATTLPVGGQVGLLLENGKAYAIKATCIANRSTANSQPAGRAMFVDVMLVHVESNLAVIDDTASIASFDNGTGFSIVYTTDDNFLIATFTGGSAGQVVNVLVTYELTEVVDSE